MVDKFFPELKEGSTKADREAAIQYNLLACEVVMADLLQKFDREYEKYGPGVLCMRLNKGARKSEYLTQEEIQGDYDLAVQDVARNCSHNSRKLWMRSGTQMSTSAAWS